MKRFDVTVSVCLLLFFSSKGHGVDAPLTIGAWGGPYEAAQHSVLFTPFEKATVSKIKTRHYVGGLEALRNTTPPDVLDMLEEEALIACEEGLVLKVDWKEFIGPGEARLPGHQDFLKGAFSECAVAHLTFSTIIAFDQRAFPGEKPQRIADFFDVDRFPGKRALKKDSGSILEWALMAEGVPTSQVYKLLSTERGMRIALRRLSAIREHIIWWEQPTETVSLLQDGEVVMASGYNGRFFEAWRLGAPINLIWDGQIIDRSVWAISSKSQMNVKAAKEFVRFALNPERQAKMAERIPYGPTRKSAFKFIGLHPESGISMTDHLPTADHHLQHALFRDTHWYAHTNDFRLRHFSQWLNAN